MPEPDSISGDIITAGTFLAGLLLVYIGNLNTGYGSFTTEQQSDVRGAFQAKAWAGFGAFFLSVVSVALALGSSWYDCKPLLLASVVLLLIVFVGGIVAAYMMVREIA